MSIITLQPDGAASRYTLAVTDALCVGTPQLRFLFGGTGLGAAVCALERATQRPLVCATAQFLSQAAPGSLLEIDVVAGTTGRFNTQAHATGRIGERVVFHVTAALGARPDATSGQWSPAPEVLAADQCVEDYAWLDTAAQLREMVDARHALPTPDRGGQPGRMLLWLRTRQDLPLDTAMLAIFADFTTGAVTETLGPGYVGNSLDNTIRICRLVPSRWILCDVSLSAVHAGFAHGDMRMYAQTGELVAVASQSMILRAIA